jgi:hypothetical protein
LGYRRSEVDAALDVAAEALSAQRERTETQGELLRSLALDLETREQRVGELERVSDHLAEQVVQRERQLQAVRAELAEAGAARGENVRALEALAVEIDDLRKQARGQATRIRMSALSEAAELSDRLAQLARTPGAAGEGLVEAIWDSVRKLGGDTAEREQAPAVEPSSNGHGGTAGLFEGQVEVEVGPLADFAKLVGFEDAARSIGAAADISIKRFSGGRATLAMTLSEPVALLHELERRSDLEFRVRDTRSDRLVLDVEDEPAA